MTNDFEAEVRTVEPKPAKARKPNKHARPPAKLKARKAERPKDTPLKTVGGTPIIERPNG